MKFSQFPLNRGFKVCPPPPLTEASSASNSQHAIARCHIFRSRNRKEIKGAIGYFVNLPILRTKLDGRLSFHQLPNRVRQTASGGYAHQDLPVQDVVEALNLASVSPSS